MGHIGFANNDLADKRYPGPAAIIDIPLELLGPGFAGEHTGQNWNASLDDDAWRNQITIYDITAWTMKPSASNAFCIGRVLQGDKRK
jgi:hypothetical protein